MRVVVRLMQPVWGGGACSQKEQHLLIMYLQRGMCCVSHTVASVTTTNVYPFFSPDTVIGFTLD